MAEAAVCHVELHLSEDGFGLYASSSTVFESSFRCQQLSGFTLVFVQAMVDLDYTPVTFGLVAHTSQRTALAVLRAVTCDFASVAACGLCVGCADTGHMLSHRADVIVFNRVVVEVVVEEWVWLVVRALLEMEAVVLDVRFHAGLVHEAIVFLGAIV